MAIVNITGGTWGTTADQRHFMMNRNIQPGSGVSVSDVDGTARIGVDSTVPRLPAANTWTGANTFTAATRTAPFRTGAGSPRAQNCTAGDTYWQLDATAGENLWTCTATGEPGKWQVLSTGSTAAAPVIEEEFLNGMGDRYGQHHWRAAGDAPPVQEGLSGTLGFNHPGVYALRAGTTVDSTSAMTLMRDDGTHALTGLGASSGWTLEAIAVLDPNLTSDGYGLRFGLSDNPASQTAANAVELRYNRNTGCATSGADTVPVYQVVSGGQPASAASSVTVNPGNSIRLRVRSTTAGTALFAMSIDGAPFTAEVPLTGVPSTALSPFFAITSCDGTAKALYVDYFRFTPGLLAR
jgi:hypothetical protein